MDGSKPFFFTEMKANSAFSSQTREWISRPKSSYIKHCCHFLCYRLLSIKRLNSIYLSGLAELLTWGDWRIFWFKLWTKANSFLYCTLIDISLRWFNRSWVVNKSWNTFKLKATGSVILYDISFYSRVTGFPFLTRLKAHLFNIGQPQPREKGFAIRSSLITSA